MNDDSQIVQSQLLFDYLPVEAEVIKEKMKEWFCEQEIIPYNFNDFQKNKKIMKSKMFINDWLSTANGT